MAREYIACDECTEDSLFLDDDGPAGKPVWVCWNCARYWENKDGKPHGEGEALGNPRGVRFHIDWPKG